jgi:NADPH2:quinone reductase
MKAILAYQFGKPNVLKLEDVEKPNPSSGEILVQIKAAGINPVDSYILTGTYARKPQLPYSPGMDGAGIVAAIGPEVKNFKMGDRVYVEDALTGTYADFCLADQNHVHLLPASLSFAQGAALGVPYATAHFALHTRAKAQKGETVFIHGGSGGVGVASIQLAKAFGLKIIATAGTDKGLQLIKQLGADHALNHKDLNYLSELMLLTQNKGVDIILEMAAHLNLGKDLTVLAANGRVVIIGSRGPVEINPRDIMGRGAIVTGMSYLKTAPEENTSIHQSLAEYLTHGKLNPIISKEVPLKDAVQALQDVMAPGAHGKIVLIP